MPLYRNLRRGREEVRRRTAEGLLRLKDGLRAQGVPDRSMDNRLLLATWNIREFDSTKGGKRGIEPMLYLAEIISAFDLVAVQEVREDLGPLDELLGYLGPWWRHIITDVTRGRSGNLERLAFLYDERKVRFSGLAGEVVLPSSATGQRADFVEQFARTPFLVGFSVGWFKFTICTAHMYYGTDKAVDPRRLAELKHLAEFLADQRNEVHAWSKNVIMLGDFNVFATGDATLRAVEDAGFFVPDALKAFKSNLGQSKHYDQIAFRTPDVSVNRDDLAAGVFKWDQFVYRSADEAAYESDRSGSSARPMAYRTWRTYQMSDHLPMWVQLETDFSRSYLAELTQAKAEPPEPSDPQALPRLL